MIPTAARALTSTLRRAGWTVRRVGDGFHVERTGASAKGEVVVQRVGADDLEGWLLTRPRASRAFREQDRWELALQRHVADEHVPWVLRRLRANVVLDVGANVGQYATRLREAGFRGRIVSFEPVSETADALRRAAAGDKRWFVRQHALGQEDTTAEIHLAGTMSSLLGASEFGRGWKAKLEDQQTETIEVRRLDGVLDEALAGVRNPRVFLKMDTQGFDLDVLRGAGDRLAEVVGLQSEVACLQLYDGMPRLPEQLTAYEAEGFELSGIFPVSRHIRSMRVIELDVVMVRAPEVADGPDTESGPDTAADTGAAPA